MKIKGWLILMVNEGRAGYTGMGCEEAKISYHISLIYEVPSGKYENKPGKSQGILRENVQECGNPVSIPSYTVLWCRNSVVRAAISIPHLQQ